MKRKLYIYIEAVGDSLNGSGNETIICKAKYKSLYLNLH